MSAEREKRARLSHACDRCRKRHVKCDGDYPICGNCKSVNGECCYSHPGSKRGYVETIDDRLSKIEQVLTKYFEGADAPQSKNPSSEAERDASGPELGVYDSVHMSHTPEKLDVNVLSESMSGLTMKASSRYFTIKGGVNKDVTPEDNVKTTTKETTRNWISEPRLPEIKNKIHEELPDEDLINHLVDCYRTHGFASRGPLIHIPTFVEQLKDKHNPPSLLLLNSLMAMSSLYTDDKRVLKFDNVETAGELFFERAISMIDDFMDRARLSTVQVD